MVLYCKYCDQGLDSVKRSFHLYQAESKSRLTAVTLNISLRTSFKTKTLSFGWNAKSWNEQNAKYIFRSVLLPQTSSLFETPALS